MHYSITRIQSHITDPDDIIKRDTLQHLQVRVGGRRFADLYIKPTKPHEPGWLSFFDGHIDMDEIRARVASTAAVLLVKRPSGFFVLSFGFGASLIKQGVAVPQFGLKATLNAIDPVSIRSLDSARVDRVARLTREQVSITGGLELFGIDVERDLLRGLTATPKDPANGYQLSGAERLGVNADIPLDKLAEALDRYAELSELDDYKQHFSFIDNVTLIKDRVKEDELTVLVVAAMNKRRLAGITMAVPEIVDWEHFAGFRYPGRNTPLVPTLDVAAFVASRTARTPVTTAELKDDVVRVVDSRTNVAMEQWSVFRCLIAEVKQKKEQFILNGGRWYRVEPNYLKAIDDAIASIELTKLALPEARKEWEAAYNKRAVAKSNGYFALLDRQNIHLPGRTAIEVSDLYGRDKSFVHVKRYGGSAVLSHLFAQGVVSSELLMYAPEYRQQVSDQLPKSHRWGDPAQPIRGEDFEVCYAIIAEKGKTVELPFFSKVSLRNAVKRLREMRYRVTLGLVPHP